MTKVSLGKKGKEKGTTFANKDDLNKTSENIHNAIRKSKRHIIVWMICVELSMCVCLIFSMKYFLHFK